MSTVLFCFFPPSSDNGNEWVRRIPDRFGESTWNQHKFHHTWQQSIIAREGAAVTLGSLLGRGRGLSRDACDILYGNRSHGFSSPFRGVEKSQVERPRSLLMLLMAQTGFDLSYTHTVPLLGGIPLTNMEIYFPKQYILSWRYLWIKRCMGPRGRRGETGAAAQQRKMRFHAPFYP